MAYPPDPLRIVAGPRPSIEAPKTLWVAYADKLALTCSTLGVEIRQLHKVIACDHPEAVWDYIEYEGKTWNKCGDCGLMEHWADGSMMARRPG